MIDSLTQWLFSTDQLMPHGFCLLWRPDLVWTHVAADATIALSYFTIPLFLVTLARRRSDLLFTWPFYLFGTFILLCGTTHLLSIISFWRPIYGLEAVVKVATGLASIGTAILVWPLLPRLLSLPNREALQRVNEELEQRVAERTEEVERANQQLTVLLQEVHHRVKNNLQVVASMLRLQQRRFADAQLRDALERSISRVHAMSLVHQALYGSTNFVSVNVGSYMRKLIEYVQQADPRVAEVKIEATADDTALPIDQSVPLALIANEVVTNALKHAFPNQRAGRVRIAVATEGGKVRLEVIDNGVGAPLDQSGAGEQGGRGFGMQIVHALAQQLGGSARYETVAGGGAHFVLEFERQDTPAERARGAGAAPVETAAAAAR
ncbi:MAG: ATP-binding protein [Alphaproteobacteria bacterium]|nr:ATP-binding protein [Alphaproteobacteria bacterium]